MNIWVARFLCRLDGHITEVVKEGRLCLRCHALWRFI